MAKIDWTFINESGTELNRYIATNVVTGEQITFRLLRNPNVIDFVQGTPLDAEKMNSLKDAINQNYDEFTTLNTKVTNIGKQVETNTKDISSMSTSLGNHNDRISANATNIRNNANSISNNSNNISNLQKSVENLNDTIIEVQQENSIINLGECGDPSNPNNTTLNSIITNGIYKFTNGVTNYLMIVYTPSSYYFVQHIFNSTGSGSFLSKYERVSNNGVSWSVKGYAGVSKDYVDNKINNSVKGYIHNITIWKQTNNAYKTSGDFKVFIKIINNSSTTIDNTSLYNYLFSENHGNSYQATGIYVETANTQYPVYEYSRSMTDKKISFNYIGGTGYVTSIDINSFNVKDVVKSF